MRGPTRPNPTRPHDAFEKLISLERVDRFTSGLLCSMSPFNKFRIWPTPIPAGACHGTWHVPRRGCRRHPWTDGEGVGDGDTLVPMERVSETPSPSVTPRPLARLRSNLVCACRPASCCDKYGKAGKCLSLFLAGFSSPFQVFPISTKSEVG